MALRLAALAAVMLLVLGAVRAAAASPLVVGAAPGPKGMVVRWFSNHESSAPTATIVRIDPNGMREAPVIVLRPRSYAEAVAAGASGLPPEAMNLAKFNADLDSKGATLGIIGSLDLALARGDAWIDRRAVNGARYRYEVTLSSGESGVTGLTPPAGSTPPIANYRVTSFAAYGGDRKISLTLQSATGRGSFVLGRSTGGAFAQVAIVSGTGPTTKYDDPAPAGTRIVYRASVIDLFGNQGPQRQSEPVVAADLHPPTAPRNLRSKSQRDSITLTWDASSDPITAGYDVFRIGASRHYTRIARLPVTARSFVEPATPGTPYFFDVRARSRYGVEGLTSGGMSSMVAKLTPPDAPRGLTAHARDGAIVLTWNASHDPTSHRYEVYERGGAVSKPLLLAELPTSSLTYAVHVPLGSTAAYGYGVGVQDSYGNRALPAEWVTARLSPPPVFVAPAPLAVTYRQGAVVLSLIPGDTSTISAERVYRGQDGSAVMPYARIGATATHYEDSHVQSEHRYEYAIAAIGSDGKDGPRSVALTVAIPSLELAGPRPSARLLADHMTVALSWPESSGIVGYQIVRTDPSGVRSTIAPLVRAFSYRDVLPPGSHGKYSYALRIIGRSGAGLLGPAVTIVK